jgi:CheY-like chemotaxis protein
VESEYGKGSEFSFDLKQKVIKWEPIGEFDTALEQFLSQRKLYQVQFAAPKARILVVDDNEINLKVFANLLGETKMQIDTADSGDACIALFKRNFYDVIFLDHMMPDKDGIETIREMKECNDTPNQKTPVICLTANAISGMRENYINAGFDDYLTKPIDTNKLENLLLTYLPQDLVNKAEDIFTEEKQEKTNSKTLHSILVVSEDVGFLKKIRARLTDKYNVVLVKSEEQAMSYLQKQEAIEATDTERREHE